MDKTVSEIIKEVEGQTDRYARELKAKCPPEPEPEMPLLGTFEEEWERLKREYPDFFKRVVIYALVETNYDQSELVRLCKYCTLHYHMPPWWTEDRLYVDTNVRGNEHPPAWTELLENIEKGVSKDGAPYKIEVLCMFQYSPAIADFCRQHNVELVIPKGK